MSGEMYKHFGKENHVNALLFPELYFHAKFHLRTRLRESLRTGKESYPGMNYHNLVISLALGREMSSPWDFLIAFPRTGMN